jgi:hypothetical protein
MNLENYSGAPDLQSVFGSLPGLYYAVVHSLQAISRYSGVTPGH